MTWVHDFFIKSRLHCKKKWLSHYVVIQRSYCIVHGLHLHCAACYCFLYGVRLRSRPLCIVPCSTRDVRCDWTCLFRLPTSLLCIATCVFEHCTHRVRTRYLVGISAVMVTVITWRWSACLRTGRLFYDRTLSVGRQFKNDAHGNWKLRRGSMDVLNVINSRLDALIFYRDGLGFGLFNDLPRTPSVSTFQKLTWLHRSHYQWRH